MVVYKKSYGPKYHSFHYSGSSTTSNMMVSTVVPLDIYISIDASSEANQFNHDVLLKDITGDFTLDAADYPDYMGQSSGYSLTFFVQGIDEPTNTLFNNTVKISFFT
jgi:hypothetical protein